MKYCDLTPLRLGLGLMSGKRIRALGIFHLEETDDPRRLERARAAVAKLQGVRSSEADHTSQVLTVNYDPGKITLEEIRNTVYGT